MLGGFLSLISAQSDYIGTIWIVTLVFCWLFNRIEQPLLVNFFKNSNPNPTYQISLDKNGDFQSCRFPFISSMKASITMITCVQIMMVDFPTIFPRYHCKAEDAGWAMMDVGVSAIMFSSGFSSSLIVSHRSPTKKRSGPL